MFTGLIQALGRVASFTTNGEGARISLHRDTLTGVARGESIAVNGVCLTFIPDGDQLFADVSSETLSRTALGNLSTGSRVNLERALALGDRLGGHIVQGHVDSVGELIEIRREGDFATFRWRFSTLSRALVVDKGSIAVDGVSLTVIEPSDTEFGAALIPETLARTNLGTARVGGRVNLEFDVFAKYAQRLIAPYLPGARHA